MINKWEIANYQIPQSLFKEISPDKMFEILEEALTAYGFDGDPRNKFNIKILLDSKDGESK